MLNAFKGSLRDAEIFKASSIVTLSMMKKPWAADFHGKFAAQLVLSMVWVLRKNLDTSQHLCYNPH